MAEAAGAGAGAGLPTPMRLAPEAGEVTMAQGRSRPAWAEIDLAAVTHNASVLAALAAPARLCAVVKAHGYGHGGPAVARAALAGGAAQLAVALVDEGVELREHGVTAPVLLLSECGPDAVETALAHGLTPTLYSHAAIAAVAAESTRRGRSTAVHLKVDTGMHRVGAPPEQLAELAAAVVAAPALELAGVWTHLPVADGLEAGDVAYTEAQLDRFDAVVATLARAGMAPSVLHAANTAGAVAFARSRYDMVRTGLGLYGYLPGAAHRAGPSKNRRAARPCGRPCRSRHKWWRCRRSTPGSAPPTVACARSRRAPAWPPCPSATRTVCPGRSSAPVTRC